MTKLAANGRAKTTANAVPRPRRWTGAAALLCLSLWLGGCAFPYFGSSVAPAARPAPSATPATPAPAAKDENAFVVSKGDTLYGISKRTGVKLRVLIDLNNLTPPYKIRPGEKLKLPSVKIAARPTVKSSTPAGPAIAAEPLPPLSQAERTPPTRQPGDKNEEKTGDRGPPAPPLSAPSASALARPDAPAAETFQPETPPADTVEPQAAEPETDLPAPPGKPFIWPVRGRILSGFGPKAGGLQNDGVNIAAAKGAPVRAVAPGEVAYIGSDLSGFGNLLLIKHDGGWITAYAHNDLILVTKGQHVGRGHIVARAGKTGNVESTQLHFELRRGTKPVDPLRYLPKIG